MNADTALSYAFYAPLALRTAKPLPTAHGDLCHAALGLVTELGELATIVKRIAIYGRALTPEMTLDAEEEIGDVAWYVPLAMRAVGMQVWHGRFMHTGSLDAAVRRVAVLVGDVCDAAKEQPLRPLTPNRVAMACGEIIFLLQHDISPRLGVDFGLALCRNVNKLRARYPAAYSDIAAEARADKGGADARSS